MTGKRTDKIQWHFTVARCCILLCCFMYADTYLVPLKKVQAVVTDKTYHAWRTRKSSGITYSFVTTKGRFDAGEGLYSVAGRGDTLWLHRSPITAVVQKVTVNKEGAAHTFSIGFVFGKLGRLFLPVLLGGLMLYHIFYHAIKWRPGRRDLLLVMLGATVLIFLFYLDLNPF